MQRSKLAGPVSVLRPLRPAAAPNRPPRPQANPHKRLRQLYGARMMAQYRGVPLGELSPHVYAIAEQVRLVVLCCAVLLSLDCLIAAGLGGVETETENGKPLGARLPLTLIQPSCTPHPPPQPRPPPRPMPP